MKFILLLFAIVGVNALVARALPEKDWWQSTVVRTLKRRLFANQLFVDFLLSSIKSIRARFKTPTATASVISKASKWKINIWQGTKQTV
jgi:hypothetical protein